MGILGSEKRKIQKILTLLKAGETKDAYELVKAVLVKNPENTIAWELLLKISKSEKERKFAQFKLSQLKKAAPPSPPKKPRKQAKPQVAASSKAEAASPVGNDSGEEIRKVISLIKEGKNRKARRVVNRVLKDKPAFPPALYASGLLAQTRKEHQLALRRLAAVGEKNPDAKPYYQKLAARKFKEKRKNRTPIWLMAGGGAVFLALIGFGLFIPVLGSEIGPPDSATILEDVAQEEMSCEELIANAMQVSDQGCTRIGTNQVCYGNDQLVSEHSGAAGDFDLTGDILEIEELQKLKASPLDLVQQLWGVAVFKLRANMPGTVPGQNVTFLAFGNTEIDNDSGDMTAFYFSTGFGGITCNGVDFDGLKIEMADGMGIEFMANDVEISLQGDAIMFAQPGGEMGITVVEGEASVTANGVTRTLKPGTSVSVPISEELAATGAPSEVEVVAGPQASLICQLYGVGCPEGETSFVLGGGSDPESTEMAAMLTPTDTLTPTISLTPTETPIGYVEPDTPTPTITNTPTETHVGFVASDTPTPTPTRTPTKTRIPTRTNTPKPGVPTTAVPTATDTLIPPTATDTPIPPTATNTPVTPAAVACSEISVSFKSPGKFQITNNGGGQIVLTSMDYDWPAANGKWDYSSFGGVTIGAPQKTPPITHTFTGHLADRTMISGASMELVTTFKNDLLAGTYAATFHFDNGCSRPAGN